MKNYSIIEDLASDYSENFDKQSFSERLFESFLRNYFLIRRYGKQEDELFLTKFKKKVIPKYVQQLFQYSAQVQQKNRKQLFSKRKIVYERFSSQRKNRKSSRQLINFTLRNQNNQLGPFSQQTKIKLTNQQPDPYKLNQKINKFEQNQKPDHKKQPQTQIKGPNLSHEPSKRLSKLHQKSTSESKVQASICNDSINLCKKFFFQTTLNQLCKTLEHRKRLDNQVNLQNIRTSFTHQSSIQSKMIRILKQKKSCKNVKMKLMSNYLNAKKPLDQPYNKENVLKIKRQGQIDFINQVHQKVTRLNLGLKGKICLPIKHKFSNSCRFQNLNFMNLRGQNIDVNFLEQMQKHHLHPQILGSNHKQHNALISQSQGTLGMSKILVNNGKRFILPTFS